MEEAIMEALLLGERESQIAMAKEIGNLNTMQKKRLAENGAIPPLVMMLHSQDCEATEASLFALLNLAFGSERNKLLIARGGAIQAILKILLWPNKCLMELGLASLFILSSCSRNKAEIGSSGAIGLLVKLLNSQNINYIAKFDIVSTLHNLSTCDQMVHLIVASGGVIAVVRLVYESDKSSELVEKAMALLEAVVSSSEDGLNQVCETGGAIRMVVEAVEEGRAACQESAAGVLLLICRSCRETYRGLILREGAMPGLLQLSVDGTWLARKKAKGLLLLLRDGGGGGAAARVKCSKNAVVEEVMRRIDRGERGGTSVKVVEEMIAKLSSTGT